MADPTTSNILLAVPTRGSDPGTWDLPVNGNSTAIDGLFGGVGTISLSNANISLTAPTGTVTPTAGPFQSQNRILVFTGALTGSVTVGLPIPGKYTVQNLTTGNFVVTFAAVNTGNVVATPQGSIMEIWNDGTNVWLVKNQMPGALTFLGGISTVPAWINACTIPPFLLCNGVIYNNSVYPALGNLYGSSFGGNGITTFGVQDLQGRVPLAYDGTGTRITVAGCGLNGQTLGAAQDQQTVTLIAAQVPNITSPITLTGTASPSIPLVSTTVLLSFQTNSTAGTPVAVSNTGFSLTSSIPVNVSGTATSNNTSGLAHPNVQPSQVSGIWLVAT